MTTRRTVLALVAAAFLFAGNAGLLARAEAAGSVPGPLVAPQWLNEHLKDVVVIDLRDDLKPMTAEPKFKTDAATGKKSLVETGGHIPGAISVDFTKIRETRAVEGMSLTAMLPTKEYFEKIMQDAGLDKGAAIVIAPVGQNIESLDMATRLFFQLKYFGEDNVAVLNGGTNGWIAAGFAVSTDATAPKKGNWVATAERKEILATTDDVKRAVSDGKTQLLDARPVAQYYGLAKSPVVLAAGHVSGARSLPSETVSRPVDGAQRFMTAEAYRVLFKQQGIDPSNATIAYCNTGHYASGGWFIAHEILGNKNARMYAGSMNEWTHLKNPVVGLPE